MIQQDTPPVFLCRYFVKLRHPDDGYSQGAGDTIGNARISAMIGWINRQGTKRPASEAIYEDRGAPGFPADLKPGEIKFGTHRYAHVKGIYKMTAAKWASMKRLRNEATKRIEVTNG
jgi:hypothetical protein